MTGGTASRRPYELGRVTADLAILTVLREEYEAVLGCLATPGLLLGSEGAPNTYAWQLGAIASTRYGATFRVVVGMGTPTTTYGALAAMQAIRLFDPRYIAFVGVAGGFDREGQCHGDVAVSSAVVGYEYGKVDTGGFAPRGDFTYRCDDGLVRAAEAVASARWWHEDEPPRPPRVRTGMIASGDKLIDDPKEALFAAVARMWPKLLAVEMEGAGVAAAVHEAQSQGHRARFVLVRGISDMPHTKVVGEGASTGERDGWKQTAARNAARFFAHLVAEAWPERPRGEVRAPSDGKPQPAGGTGLSEAVASGSVAGGAGPAVGGVMVSPASGQTAPARWEPAGASEEINALSRRLQDAYVRKKRLLEAGAATDVVNREINDIKRQLREGGRLRAGDSLGDGRYVLVEELGRGGFAVVWKAKDEIAKADVAIKVLHTNLAGDTIRRERFYRGARAMRKLQHPGVVRVLDPEGEDGGFCYFVMELVPNGNLHDAVVGKRGPEGAVLGHILRVGEALGEAHSQGMIHRDIKPQNILLDEGFEAKLTDFDLVGAQDTTGGTRTGAMGTFIYSAPECLEKPQEATARVDVYGLGMTAIFCLAGKALTRSMLRDLEPTIAGLDCVPAVKEVLRRAVAWEPEARYADADAMVSALRAAMSIDLGEKVIKGDAGSGAEASGVVPSNVARATSSESSIVNPPPAVPIAPGAPMPLSPGAPSAGDLLLEPQVSGGGLQPDEPRVLGGSSIFEPVETVQIQSRQIAPIQSRQNKLRYALIGLGVTVTVITVVAIVALKSNTRSDVHGTAAQVQKTNVSGGSDSGGDDGAAAQAVSTMDKVGTPPDKNPDAAAGKPTEIKLADNAAEPKTSDPRPTAALTNPVPAPAPSKEAGIGCDEASCILNSYEGVCCAKFKKGRTIGRSADKRKPAEAKPANKAAEPKPSDSKPREPSLAESRDVKPAASASSLEPIPAADLKKLPPSACDSAEFVPVYNAEAPSKEQIQTALRKLNACHDAGKINDSEFPLIQKAILNKLL